MQELRHLYSFQTVILHFPKLRNGHGHRDYYIDGYLDPDLVVMIVRVVAAVGLKFLGRVLYIRPAHVKMPSFEGGYRREINK